MCSFFMNEAYMVNDYSVSVMIIKATVYSSVF